MRKGDVSLSRWIRCNFTESLGLESKGRFCVSGAGDGRITVWSLSPGLPGLPAVYYTTKSRDEAMAVLVKMITQKLVVCRHILDDFPHGFDFFLK